MKTREKILSGIIFFLSLISCQSNSLRQEYSDFTSRPIVIPQSLTLLNGADVIHSNGRKYIVYCDTTECAMCKLKDLSGYILAEYALSKHDIPICIVLSVISLERDDFVEEIQRSSISLPIYLDDKSEMLHMNKFPDDRFYSFLMDENNFPLFVGDPASPKIRKLMQYVL